MFSTFEVDEDELKKLNAESRAISKSIQELRALRKSFRAFLRSLNANSLRDVPLIPPKLRSNRGLCTRYYKLYYTNKQSERTKPKRQRKPEREKAKKPKARDPGLLELTKALSELTRKG